MVGDIVRNRIGNTHIWDSDLSSASLAAHGREEDPRPDHSRSHHVNPEGPMGQPKPNASAPQIRTRFGAVVDDGSGSPLE